MIQPRIDLSAKGFGTRQALSAAAVEVWLEDCVGLGGWPRRDWTPAHDRRVRARARELDAAEHRTVAAWPTGVPLAHRGRWRLRHAGWAAIAGSLVAALPVESLDGAPAATALGNARELGAQVRLCEATFTRADTGEKVHAMFGAVVTERSLAVFEPSTGLYELPVGAANPLTRFAELMTTVHGASNDITCTTLVIDVLDVFVTWFGRPAAQREASSGLWPDVKGVVDLASGAMTGGPRAGRPHITFVCQAQHRAALTARIAQEAQDDAVRIDVRAVDDHFDGGLPAGAFGAGPPDFTDLKATVRRVLSRSLADPTDIRSLVNGKVVWAYYLLYAMGGYTVDAGVVLAPGRVTAPLPVPDRFATNWVRISNPQHGREVGWPYEHRVLAAASRRWDSGVGCFTCPSHSVSLGVVVDPGEVHGDVTLGTFPMVDVPLMRSPRGSHGAEVALRTYLDLWFRMQPPLANGITLDDESRKRLCELAVVSAAATGLSHPAPASRGCGFVLPAAGTNLFAPADLGLRKTGQQSHRTNPLPRSGSGGGAGPVPAGRR